ncbi:MAG: CPBP family intramembrane metalloprotease [Spirochaetes bacterium]|nr:CPBP family intramembrane metalloprotease [Spirochaetota bacterium]
MENRSSALQPMSWTESLALFGVPGLGILALTYLAVPRWVASGFPLIWSWSLALFIPLALTNAVVVGNYLRKPGHDVRSFGRRIRLRPPRASDWKWIAAGFLATGVLSFAMEWTQPILRELFPLQPVVPELFVDPYAAAAGRSGEATFFGVSMEGQWWLIPFWLVWLAVMVTLEETLWRGFALPRMEQKYGAAAFVVNGLLWTIPFHLYTYWNVLTDLPMYLIVPFVAYKTRSTTASWILHFLLPLMALAYLIPGIIG